MKRLQNPLRLFTNVDILILLGITAIVNSVMYGIITTISTTFEATYPFLTETTIGLCFLAYGGGMMIGSVVHGKVLDREFQKFKRKLVGEGEDISRAELARRNIALEKVMCLSICSQR
jgi:predicted MFS family arabinose efflux permease